MSMDERQGQGSLDRDGDDALQALVLRLLGSPHDGLAGRQDTRLLVGQLPPDLPVDIPLPSGRLLGSQAIHGGEYVTIVLETAAPVEQVYAFYRQRLTADGWQRVQMTIEGWAPADEADDQQADTEQRQRDQYVRSDDGPRLVVHVEVEQSGGTLVWLTLLGYPDESPRGFRDVRRLLDRPAAILSALAPPPDGSRLFVEDGGGGESRATATSRIESDEGIAQVAAHYIAQLERIGWARTGAGIDGALAWSAWMLPDVETAELWQALFSILELPWAGGQYYLTLEIERVHDGDQPSWERESNRRVNATHAHAGGAVGGSPDRRLRDDLLRRLFAPRSQRQQGGETPRLLVGQLPTDPRAAIPLPEGSHIAGSMEWSDAGAYTIVLDVDQPWAPLLDAYRRQLLDNGWQERRRLPGHAERDFSSADPTQALFVQGNRRLSVDAGSTPDGLTDVRLSLDTTYEEPLPLLGLPDPRELPRLLPDLPPPTGDRQAPTHSRGARDGAHAGATLTTDRDIAAVAAHYAGRLEQAGWSAYGSGIDGALAWSTWTAPGPEGDRDPAQGRFLVARSPFDPRRYNLYVQARRGRRRPSSLPREYMFASSVGTQLP
jgi:hypothetical protein